MFISLIHLAIREILNASDVDFAAELREKQEDLDKTNAALKESGAALTEERRKLEELQSRVREKTEVEQKIKNLERVAVDLREQLGPGNVAAADQVVIGDADKGLDLGGYLPAIERLFPAAALDPSLPPSPEQTNFMSSLERAEVLSGRVRAYLQHNQTLENQAKTLKSRSAELEERYREIVSLCTGAKTDKVDNILDNLVQAVVSEQKENVEIGRVRDFLRMLQSNES